MQENTIVIKDIVVGKEDLSFVKKEELTLMIKLKSCDNINYISYGSKEDLDRDFYKLYQFLMKGINQSNN